MSDGETVTAADCSVSRLVTWADDSGVLLLDLASKLARFAPGSGACVIGRRGLAAAHRPREMVIEEREPAGTTPNQESDYGRPKREDKEDGNVKARRALHAATRNASQSGILRIRKVGCWTVRQSSSGRSSTPCARPLCGRSLGRSGMGLGRAGLGSGSRIPRSRRDARLGNWSGTGRAGLFSFLAIA